jgi:hypothetical protein
VQLYLISMVFLPIYCRNLVKPECYTAEVAMCFTTAALIRKGDVLGAIGEHGLEGASAYSWLIDSGVTHSMTPHRSNYATFTRGTLSITVGNGEATRAKGYRDILIDLPNQSTASELPAEGRLVCA